MSYSAERAALEALYDTYVNPTGLSVLQGPVLSGKSTLIRRFIDTLHEDCAVALVDGKGLNTTALLTALLHDFGFDLETGSANELMGLVRVFALQQATAHEPPVLVIENTHEMRPSALYTLCELADLRVRTGSAIKIVIVSDRSLASVLESPAMLPISRRLLHDFHLHPMTQEETKQYLHSKLRAAGSNSPDLIFSDAVCNELWAASEGWPGILDRLALLSLARAESLPVAVHEVERASLPNGTWDDDDFVITEHDLRVVRKAPHLIVSENDKVVDDLKVEKPRMLIGRSGHNDISIDSRFISRHHALLVHHGNSTFLMDLNSTNGTFVNAKRISNHVLVDDDVISIGNHKIKFNDPHAQTRGQFDSAEIDDTIIMKTLDDMRNLLAQENTTELPSIPEDLSEDLSEDVPHAQA
jgi:type II secretory pathway predicted ATPase ExeA